MNYLIPLHWNHPIQCAIITSSFFVWTPAFLWRGASWPYQQQLWKDADVVE